jgi:hypothetical protein
MEVSSFLLKGIRGAIGKQFVVKKYGKKTILAKYPDMSAVVASEKQLLQQKIFRTATQYAKDIYADAALKKIWQEKTGERLHLFSKIISVYLNERRELKGEAA